MRILAFLGDGLLSSTPSHLSKCRSREQQQESQRLQNVNGECKQNHQSQQRQGFTRKHGKYHIPIRA